MWFFWQNHRYIHLSAGDLLRAERNSGSKDAELINDYIKEGKIVPVEITVNLLKKAMELNGWEKNKFLIDGFPRSQDNLQGWNDVMSEDVNVSHWLFLNTTEDVMTQRILKRAETSGRVDDNEEAIKKRLKTYLESTMPIIRIFEEQGKTIEVDSSKEVDEVFKTIETSLGLE